MLGKSNKTAPEINLTTGSRLIRTPHPRIATASERKAPNL